MDERDVVFAPNKAGEGQFRLNDMLRCCRRRSCAGWTCKSTATKGDLYVFYFGAPECSIAAMGVCADDACVEENDGSWDWTASPRGWFGHFKPLVALPSRVRMDEIKADPLLADWWNGKPYYGLPKTIPSVCRDALLGLIAGRNPSLSKFLSPYHDGPVRSLPTLRVIEEDERPPKRIPVVTIRCIRDTLQGNTLKRLYDGKCQLCGRVVRLPDPPGNQYYCEVHHLRPLGNGHRGLDNIDNMLVLCPTCHTEFDYLVVGIEPGTRDVVRTDGGKARRLTFAPGHKLSDVNVQHHWRRYQDARKRA